MNLLDNVICLTPFFDNPSITEDRGEDNENDFSENGESVPYMFIFLDQKNHFEREGEKESKPVTVHADNHTLTVGDDLKYYKLEGNQLTIEDDDRDPSDTIVLTK